MPKWLFLIVALAAPAQVVAQSDSGGSGPGVPRGADSLPLLGEAWQLAADNVYPPELRERFNPAALMRLQNRLRADDAIALADVFNPFLDSLGVSHTRFYDRRQQSYYMLSSLFSTRDLDRPALYTIGVQLDERDPGLVRAVLEGSPAAEAGIRRGSRIVSVDGVPFESLLQWQRRGRVSLTVRSDSGIRNVILRTVFQGFQRSLVEATLASKRVIDCGDRRVGYLHLWSGTNAAFLNALQDFVADARVSGLDGLVLDLRDGYGGAWWQYLDPFFGDRDDYFTATTVDARGSNDPQAADPQTNADAWTGPLAVLVNAGTRSGKEALAFQFKKTGRAVLYGTATAGAFTGGRGVFAERNADYLFYLSVQETLLDGQRIEGAGIRPDVVVADTADGDDALAAALDAFACEAEAVRDL